MYFIEGLPSVNEDPPNNDASDPVVLDTDSLAFLRRDREERSVAMTHLASEIGSVVGTPRNARIKSFTYYPSDNDVNSDATGVDWILDLADGKIARKPRVIVHAVDGVLAAVSRIQVGDYLQSINDTKIGTRWDAAQAQQHLQTRLATDGYLSVATVDPQGDEVWIQATIVKPRPDMTLTDLGMTVWVWGYLCIKSIDRDSIFRHSVLKSTDHIVSVNNIICDGIKAADFAHVVQQIPREITITVLRRKQRLTGMFR